MGISKTEVNLKRLLAAAPQQQNQAKLVHYVATLREQLEQLTEEKTPEGLPRLFYCYSSDSLDRAASSTEYRAHEPAEIDHLSSVKLDAAGHAHIEKHRKLQDDLTDEMVVLANQLKESSLMMSQSVKNTEKILDSTEEAIEHSLASTGRVNVRANTIYSESSKTSCLTLLVMFVMTCVFVMVILLIRVT